MNLLRHQKNGAALGPFVNGGGVGGVMEGEKRVVVFSV